jgi:hypothetical protein
VLAAASEAASGSSTGTTSLTRSEAQEPERSRDLATRATYRTLMMRGLAPEEAANLTAFMVGIHVGEQHWKLNEVNRLLFLRVLNQQGRFAGEADRPSIPSLH